MKPQGMIWYNILKWLVPFGVLLNIYTPVYTLSNLAAQENITLSFLINHTITAYAYTYIAYGITMAIFDAVFVVYLRKKSASCVHAVRAILIADTVGIVALEFAAAVSFQQFNLVSIAISLAAVYLFWMPTYVYLKKRF